MKILYIAQKFNYGDPSSFSFEHYNFYGSLLKMEDGKHEIIYFPFDELLTKFGQKRMNAELLDLVETTKPDLCFFFLFDDEISPETIKEINKIGIKTFNWFADDHWRFDNYSKYWAPLFTWCSTTDSKASEKYYSQGYKNIIKTQWACNHFLYHPSDSNRYNVSFVGQPHGNRKKIINHLTDKGIKVDCFGNGWPNSFVSQNEMIEIFGQSKINLNLTKSSGGIDLKSLAKILVSKKNGHLKLSSPRKWLDNFKSFVGRQREQIKGRNFEIPGCGGMLLTSSADNLEEYYLPDKEIVLFKNEDELAKKINYYLNHEEERVLIAKAGYERTIKDHTYEKRFMEIFKIMGLQ